MVTGGFFLIKKKVFSQTLQVLGTTKDYLVSTVKLLRSEVKYSPGLHTPGTRAMDPKNLAINVEKRSLY